MDILYPKKYSFPMKRYILTIDQGTTGSTVSLWDQQGEMVLAKDMDHKQIYPQPGWVEHDAEEIWKNVLKLIQSAVTESGVKSHEIAGIGITNQRETVVVWDRKTLKPVYNAIVWQCRRTTEMCAQLKKKKMEKKVRAKTGLFIDPYFSALKIQWILKNVPNLKKRAAAGELAVGTMDCFLIAKLTQGEVHRTDVSNASRTQLMNLKTGQWDEELLKIFEVPRAILPDIFPSSGSIGHVQDIPGLPDGLPIAGVVGDQQSALFGQGCFTPGDAKCTFGTGSFLLMNTGLKAIASKAGLLTTVAWKLNGDKKLTYALEGGAFICGAAVQWLRDEMKMIQKSSEVETLARQVTDSGGVQFVPAFVGLGAPYWMPEARGMIMGMTRGSNRAHLARAVLEAMALQNVDILEAMQKDSRRKISFLRVDGGATENSLLMQMQSDYVGIPVHRPHSLESTSRGAAFMAGLGVGLWNSLDELRKLCHIDKEFKPSLSKKDKDLRLKQWHRAIDAVAEY